MNELIRLAPNSQTQKEFMAKNFITASYPFQKLDGGTLKAGYCPALSLKMRKMKRPSDTLSLGVAEKGQR